MSSAIERMIDILDRQREEQRSLLDLAQRKVRAIADGNVDALQAIIDGEQEALVRISAIERDQNASIGELAQELGVPASDVCMSLLIERAAPEESSRLAALREELTTLVEQQTQHNAINMKLLEMNMQYVQFMINTSVREQVVPTYGAGADTRSATTAARTLLDRKV